MRVVFRTDASIQIGTGHVMRCLTLANALRQEGAESTFICRAHAGHLGDWIAQSGHAVILLPLAQTDTPTPTEAVPPHANWLGCDWHNDAQQTQEALQSTAVNWLIVDHYALDARWEKALRPMCDHLMVIDDLADRPHDCDVLLDQNLGRSVDHYRPLIPHSAQALVGPHYALLRPEFALQRTNSLARRKAPQLQHILITLGGIDKENHTSAVLHALMQSKLPTSCRITVVMGQHAPALADIQNMAKHMPWSTSVLVNVSNMAELMAGCDLVIGAAGGTAWERCSLGVPSLVLITAANQRTGAEALEKIGAIKIVAHPSDLPRLIEHPTLSGPFPIELRQLSEAASHVTDGQGTRHVMDALRGIYD